MLRFFAIILFCGSIILASLVALYFGAGANRETKRVIIRDGASLAFTAQILHEAEIIHNAGVFRSVGRLFGYSRDIRAGEYDIAPYASMADVFYLLRKGDVVLHPITISEGLSSAQITNTLLQNELLIGGIAPPAEGVLLPETYYVRRGTARTEIIERMRIAQKETLAALWQGRQKNLPLKTPYEALILASLVEKETGKAGERADIAAVFHNRLRRKMRLQSDPTIIYGLVKGAATLGRPILRSDIQSPTPYNTYRINGLPPTPITNAGRAALLAVLHPSNSRALYFVADGKGGHRFAETLAEHNKNVRAYRKTQQ